MRPIRSLALLALSVTALLACGDDEPTATDDANDTTATAGPTTSSIDATSTSAAPGVVFPPEDAELSHGGSAWAVVLAGAASADASILQEAEAAATAAGYRTGPTDCDVGAPEALGIDEEAAGGSVYTVSVYFEREADARTAHDAFQQTGWEGGAVAEVQTFCMD